MPSDPISLLPAGFEYPKQLTPSQLETISDILNGKGTERQKRTLFRLLSQGKPKTLNCYGAIYQSFQKFNHLR